MSAQQHPASTSSPSTGDSAAVSAASPAETSVDARVESRFIRTTLLSRIAHDIRAPTGVAAGALHELESALGASAPDHKMWLTMLHRGLKRLLRLADRLSMVAELEERSMLPARVRVEMAPLVRKAVEAAAFVQSRSSVTIDTEIADDVYAMVDSRWLEPAITDVLCNAIRFAHRRVRISLTGGNQGAVLAIEDDGSGISPEAMSTLFYRFVPRPSGSGVGLSLSVAHAVVVGHGGKIRVEPSTLPPGRGEARGARIVVELDDAPAAP